MLILILIILRVSNCRKLQLGLL